MLFIASIRYKLGHASGCSVVVVMQQFLSTTTLGPGGHFTNTFSPVNHIYMKAIPFHVTQIMTNWSLRKFAHVTTAVVARVMALISCPGTELWHTIKSCVKWTPLITPFHQNLITLSKSRLVKHDPGYKLFRKSHMEHTSRVPGNKIDHEPYKPKHF